MGTVLRVEVPLRIEDVWMECPFHDEEGNKAEIEFESAVIGHPKTLPCENGLISLQQAMLWTMEQAALAYKRP